MHLLLSPKRELDADLAAARFCESPNGVAGGLVLLDQASELVAFRESPSTEPLCVIHCAVAYACSIATGYWASGDRSYSTKATAAFAPTASSRTRRSWVEALPRIQPPP